MKRLSPDAELWRLFRLDSRTRRRKIKEDARLDVPKSQTTVFHELLTSGLPESEKGVERTGMEAQALGSGTSSKPTNPRLYNSHALSADLASLLAAASITQNVVAIGHDWGSYAAQRLWLWQPQLVCGLGLLNVGYMAPATAPFDVAALNDATEQATGWPRFAYWELFVAEDGARVLDGHLESFWGVLHGEDRGGRWMREMFCTRGAMRAFLERDGRVGALREYARPGQGWKEEWFREVEEGGGGLDGALGPYRAMVGGHQYEVERTLPPERVKVTVPAFFLGCEQDEVCTMDLVEENRKAGLLPDLTVKVIDSGHWCTMEKPDEVGEALYDWLVEKF
ncbi:Epoxide hydrolase 2 [Diplodia seriata]|uniref:Epoxide hydrolase 2 n=1 Tax=Diplodia seriata TaxID=420778 RepID=A0A1S8BF67_9PEZI|nr:Epoxide hydrolase 2 [Diplodia seriata]